MTIRVERELSQTLLVVEETGIYRENYQVRMMRANRIEGLLPISARGIDERTVYTYDISGKVSMKNRFAKKKIGAKAVSYTHLDVYKRQVFTDGDSGGTD